MALHGEATVSEVVDTIEFGAGTYRLVSYGGRYFASVDINEILTPRAFVAIPNFAHTPMDIGQYLDDVFGPEHEQGQLAYARGFGTGLLDTGVGVWDGFVSIGDAAWYLVSEYNTVSMGIRLFKTGNPLKVEDQQRIMAAAGVVEQVAGVLWKLRQDQAAAIEAVIAGDDDTLNQLGEEYAVYLEFAYEIIDELRAELAVMSDYDAGRLVGRVAGEIGLAIASGGAGAALKSTTITNVATKVKGSALASSMGTKYGISLSNALDRVPVRATAIATSGMCFVAGTLVHTQAGLMPIEQVRQGDLVLSRDPETGVQLYKRVANTITTHPSELYVVVYGIDVDGNGTADSVGSLTTTAEHPFYVQELDAFVPAAELKVGQVLALAQSFGTTAYVTDIQVQRGPPALGTPTYDWDGHSYTTYNFEVEGFHTYFVGEAGGGVWVHNVARTKCEQVVAVSHMLRKRHPELSDRQLYELLFTKLPRHEDDCKFKAFVEIFNASPNKGPGNWTETARTFHTPVNGHYQTQSSGSPFMGRRICEYRLDDVDFDDYKPGAGGEPSKLIERKGRHAQFVDPATGQFKPFWTGLEDFVREANRQLDVARNNGIVLEWHCMEPEVADAVSILFQNRGLEDIVVKHIPLE